MALTILENKSVFLDLFSLKNSYKLISMHNIYSLLDDLHSCFRATIILRDQKI